MTITEQVYAQALAMAGDLEEKDQKLLGALCTGVVTNLTARLREPLAPEDCAACFVTAASLHALADLGCAGTSSIQEFRAGDLTVKQGGMEAAARGLKRRAEGMMAPFLRDGFSFRGV